MTTLRLVDDNGVTLLSMVDGGDTNPILSKLDLGYPTVRAVTTPQSGQDGDNDLTELVGSRGVVAEGLITFDGAPDALADTIRALMHPGRRYWLHALLDGWPAERRIQVRGASLSLPMGPLPWPVQLGWAAPKPAFQDVTLSSVSLSPTAAATGGFAFPITFPAAAQPGLVPGAAIIQVAGSVASLPTVDIYGPCSGPLFRVLDTGLTLSFPNLSIAQGDYLHIDCAARTITLNNDPGQPRYQTLDFAASVWPSLPPGRPEVVFSAASTSPATVAIISWRNQWL